MEKPIIIILNGCPSAGKTSIIKEMQNLYPHPLLSMGIDRFWAMIPSQYKEDGSKADKGYLFSQTHDSDNNLIVQVKKGPFALHLQTTIPKVINLLADCGHNVIADEIMDNEILHNYVNAIKNQVVYFIGITCDIKELEKREKVRENRLLGLARGYIDNIHKSEPYYDLIIDTTNTSSTECAQNILRFIEQTPNPSGFEKLRKSLF